MTVEALKVRLATAQQDKDRAWGQFHFILGVIADCEFWLKEQEKESEPLPDPASPPVSGEPGG